MNLLDCILADKNTYNQKMKKIVNNFILKNTNYEKCFIN